MAFKMSGPSLYPNIKRSTSEYRSSSDNEVSVKEDNDTPLEQSELCLKGFCGSSKLSLKDKVDNWLLKRKKKRNKTKNRKRKEKRAKENNKNKASRTTNTRGGFAGTTNKGATSDFCPGCDTDAEEQIYLSGGHDPYDDMMDEEIS